MAKKPTKAKATAAAETPEAQPTKAGKQAAAQDQFDKADAAGDVRADEIRVGLAARGF
jgi:hypothetical protein